MHPAKTPRLIWALAGSLYLAVALALMAPVLASPTTLALGHPETDTYNHVWGYWHTAASLANGEAPWRVRGLAWPDGGSLWFIDQAGALVLAPVTALFGPVLSYNLWLLSNLVWAGLASFGLARQLGLRAAAAGVAGLAYATCPHVLGQLYDGISETATTGWLPAALIAVLRLRDDPGPRRGAVAGATLGLTALCSWYYGLFAALATVGILGRSALGQPRRWLRPMAWRGLVATGLTGAVVAGPAFALFSRTLSAPDALVRRDEAFVALTLAGHNQVDLWSFFRPGRVYSPDLRALYDEALITIVYAGWTLIFAAVVALWRTRREADGLARPLVAVAAVCFVLAQGPWLYVSGDWVELPGLGPLPLPFLALTQVVPGFASMSHAFRFAVPMGLALALLAGLAVDRLRPGLAVGLGSLWLAELALISPAVLPLPVSDTTAPACHAALADVSGWAAAPGSAAVLDLPVSLQVLARSRYAGWQVRHGLGIPYALNDPTPPTLMANRLALAIVGLERSSVDTVGPVLPALDLAIGARALALDGYRAIAVHGDLYPPTTRRKVLELLGIVLGSGEIFDDCTLFPLPDPRLAAIEPSLRSPP